MILTIYNPNLLQVEGEVNDGYRENVRLNEVAQVSVPAVAARSRRNSSR